MDMKEAMSFNLSELENRYIEVYETTEIEYNKAKSSQFPDKREATTEQNFPSLVNEQNGIIKMRGLPYSCTEEDITMFFKNYKIVQNGIKRAIIGGKPSGECYVVFETKEDANQALSLNMEKIGSRFIELFPSNLREFENYMTTNFINTAPTYSKDHMPNIPIEKRKSTLMVVGLPFNVTKDGIKEFFAGYKIEDKDLHMLPTHSGKFSGNALLTFEDELEAQRALKTKNLSYLGNRYIELYEYK